jgi:hypothetical protein
MDSNEFNQLVEKRERLYNAILENDTDLSSILSGLYSDSSHFVYELLQNAEDAKATSVSFSLLSDRLEVTHNGKSFSFPDVDSITNIGKSTKADDITAIGKFGVGFKSVYAITQSPTIKSGKFNFTIRNFVVPSINPDGQTQDKTSIILPFDHQSRAATVTHTLVRNRLENLGLLTLLFLKHISKVDWNDAGSGGQYERFAESKYRGFENVRRVKLRSSSSMEEYLVFERPISIEQKQLRVEVAYKLSASEAQKEGIAQSTTSKLFVFLPTNEETYLKFLVQGPFRTTPARDNIPFEDENNKYLIQEIAKLVSDSLPIVRELGLLDISFLNILPIKDLPLAKQDIYKEVSAAVVRSFKSNEPLLPSLRIPHCTATTALLANGKDLTVLLDSSDTYTLFKKTEWMHPDVTERRTPDIRDFLMKQLGVQEIDFETFARNLSQDFLKTKDASWFNIFYQIAQRSKELWRPGFSYHQPGILRSKPIILLEDARLVAPFDSSGNPQAYLPSTSNWKTHFNIVHAQVAADEESLSFLKELGLREPDLYAEISEYVIPKYEDSKVVPASDEYFEDFLNLLIGFQEVRSDRKRQFLESIKTLPFLLCTKSNSPVLFLGSPSDSYLRIPELQEYFSGYHEAFFISEQIYTTFNKEEVDDFLSELGVSELPRRIQLNGTLSWGEKRELYRTIGHTRDILDHDYEIHGLDNFLSNISRTRSILLWKLLLKHIEAFGWRAEEFFKGDYKWFYRKDQRESFDAKFIKQLRQSAWLFDQSDQRRNSISFLLSALAPDYDIVSPASQVLIHHLQFKSDIQQQLLQQFPESERKAVEVFLSFSPEQREQLIKDNGRSKTSQPDEPDADDWKPEVTPEAAEISQQPFAPATHDVPLPELPTIGDHNDDGKDNGDKPEGEPDSPPTKHPKEIGHWGELHVFKALFQEYDSNGVHLKTDSGAIINTQQGQTIEIFWLNIEKDQGRGCDFIISLNGEKSRYIEVKSTSENEHQLHRITGRQWELARKLYDNGNGDQYCIYRVFNAGKENARILTIQNPIELWKAGKLYAHPINLEL